MKLSSRPSLIPAALLAAFVLSAHAAAEVRSFVEDTGILRGWELVSGGVSLQQIQRLPDQTRAFFQGRGFPAEAANRLATACVFQTILRNQSGAPIEADLAEWRIEFAGKTLPLNLTAHWQAEWEAMQLPKPARIAFQWAMFPNRQTYQAEDWNMGMIAYPLRPGDRFDLHAQWRQGGEVQRATLAGLECAPDLAAESLPKLNGEP